VGGRGKNKEFWKKKKITGGEMGGRRHETRTDGNVQQVAIMGWGAKRNSFKRVSRHFGFPEGPEEKKVQIERERRTRRLRDGGGGEESYLRGGEKASEKDLRGEEKEMEFQEQKKHTKPEDYGKKDGLNRFMGNETGLSQGGIGVSEDIVEDQ